jgi:hypothetical protein
LSSCFADEIIIGTTEGLLVLDYLVENGTHMPGIDFVYVRKLHLFLEEKVWAVVTVSDLGPERQSSNDRFVPNSVEKDTKAYY